MNKYGGESSKCKFYCFSITISFFQMNETFGPDLVPYTENSKLTKFLSLEHLASGCN